MTLKEIYNLAHTNDLYTFKKIILNKVILKEPLPTVNTKEIVHTICSFLGLNVETVKSKSRLRELVRARRIICLVLSDKFKLSELVIANVIHRDRTSAYHLIKTGFDALIYDKEFLELYTKVDSLFEYSHET